MKPFWVPAVPVAVSLALSLSTVGGSVGWQDSGFYLAAVKELGILYPTGFVLYLLLCKAWTLIFFFLPFTVAVHLFSAACAAGAAGALALASRDFLRARGPIFRVLPEDPGPLADGIGAAVGCLAASGYTLWASGIYAKVYAFYFLVLALLLWRMIRADESGKGRDFTIVAVLIGLAWQAHPSAATTGLGLILFVGFHRRTLGWKGILGRVGAAAACAIGPLLLLPLLAAREPALMFGDPRSLPVFKDYVLGSRFTGIPGVFGLEESRVRSVGLYFWEEFLGIGVIAVLAGLVRLVRLNPRLLLGLAGWVVPVLAVTALFKIEGQHDFWFVAAWLPLWIVGGLGLHEMVRAAGARARPVVAALTLVALAWAAIVNHPLLNQRGQTLAETMGRVYLDHVDPGAILILASDDSLSACEYLQIVRGHRKDVILVHASHLGEGGEDGWYDALLHRRHPGLRRAGYGELRRRFPRADRRQANPAAFANANVSPERPVFFGVPPAAPLVRPDYRIIAAGAMFKMAPRGREQLDPKYWTFPIEAEEVRQRFRRERGQFVQVLPGRVTVRPEAYEQRLLRELLRARKNLADALALAGTPEAYRRVAEIYETIVRLEPATQEDPGAVYPLAGAYFAIRRHDLAEPWLRKALELELPPAARAQVLSFLSEICRESGRTAEGERWAAQALAMEELEPDLRRKLEGRAKSR